MSSKGCVRAPLPLLLQNLLLQLILFSYMSISRCPSARPPYTEWSLVIITSLDLVLDWCLTCIFLFVYPSSYFIANIALYQIMGKKTFTNFFDRMFCQRVNKKGGILLFYQVLMGRLGLKQNIRTFSVDMDICSTGPVPYFNEALLLKISARCGRLQTYN